ncbi:hypothetical protein PUN28_012825 [Cardiocondyla obscurior]|uniref:Uncharacterized protein n=1 Tax=Cardiocondyla obscurior TaxID=286306 RepID=A0AAW2F6T0_9HYME
MRGSRERRCHDRVPADADVDADADADADADVGAAREATSARHVRSLVHESLISPAPLIAETFSEPLVKKERLGAI